MTERQSDYQKALQHNAQLRAENQELKKRLNNSRTYYSRIAHLWKTRYMRLREGSRY
jgi:hypothetical protein